MAGAVEQSGKHSKGQADGIGLLLLNLGQPLLLEPLEVGAGERGMKDHVAIDIEGGVEVLGQRLE